MGLSRTQLTLHATRRTPHGASHLVQATSTWSVKTRRALSRHCRDARVYGHTTTAMHDMSTPPPVSVFIHNALFWPVGNLFSSGLVLFPHVLVGRTGAPVHYTQVWPRLSSVARALGVQSRVELFFFAGSLSAEPEPSRMMDTQTQKNEQKVFACSVLCVTVRTSPGCLATSHLERCHLATSHLDPPHMQQQSRFELIYSCPMVLSCVYVVEDDQWKYLTNSGAIGLLSIFLLRVHLLKVELLI